MCVGRMGATAIDSPHRRRLFFWVGVVPSTPWRIDVFFGVLLCFSCVFGALVCVWKVFFVLSNIVNYRKKILYSSTNCDSENASPILVENPHSLRESLKNYYPVAEKNVASFKDQREYTLVVSVK